MSRSPRQRLPILRIVMAGGLALLAAADLAAAEPPAPGEGGAMCDGAAPAPVGVHADAPRREKARRPPGAAPRRDPHPRRALPSAPEERRRRPASAP